MSNIYMGHSACWPECDHNEEVLNLTLDGQVNMHDWFISDVDPDPVFWGAV